MPLEERTLKYHSPRHILVGSGFRTALSTFLFLAVFEFCKGECYSPILVEAWGVKMCMVKFLRGWICPFLGLLCSGWLLETSVYYIRIIVVFCGDTTVVGQRRIFGKSHTHLDFGFLFLQNEGMRLDLLRAF